MRDAYGFPRRSEEALVNLIMSGGEVARMGSEAEDSSLSALPVWDRAAALDRLGGDEELLKELLGMLLEQISAGMAGIAQAIEHNDPPSLEHVAHSLKGAAASLAAERFRQRAWGLELMGRSGDLSGAQVAFGRLEDEDRRLCDTLRA